MKFRKKPVEVEASQWFVNGDHPNVSEFLSPLGRACTNCRQARNLHGWVDTLEGGHVVCPGDWIITDHRVTDPKGHGHFYPCKPDIFEATYERVDDRD